jgi:hypothetical protein
MRFVDEHRGGLAASAVKARAPTIGGSPKRLIAETRRDRGGFRAPPDYRTGVRLRERLTGELRGRVAVGV